MFVTPSTPSSHRAAMFAQAALPQYEDWFDRAVKYGVLKSVSGSFSFNGQTLGSSKSVAKRILALNPTLLKGVLTASVLRSVGKAELRCA